MAYVVFVGASGETLGTARFAENDTVAFSAGLRFLAQQPVVGMGDRILTPTNGVDYLRALVRQYSGSYLTMRWREGEPPTN